MSGTMLNAWNLQRIRQKWDLPSGEKNKALYLYKINIGKVFILVPCTW